MAKNTDHESRITDHGIMDHGSRDHMTQAATSVCLIGDWLVNDVIALLDVLFALIWLPVSGMFACFFC